MAKYDPKRPVLLADDDDVAQVDALLDSTTPDAADDRSPVEDVPVSGSDVPVVTPPDGGTLNRAVLGAAVLAVVSVLTAILVLRRRKRG